jgi:hypothetical protein
MPQGENEHGQVDVPIADLAFNQCNSLNDMSRMISRVAQISLLLTELSMLPPQQFIIRLTSTSG